MKKSTVRKLIAGTVFALACSANAEEVVLSIDKYYSPFMGANWMISGFRGYETIDDVLFSGTYGQTCPKDTFIRTAKLGLDFTVSSFAGVLQHEIFGHGARAREFHLADVNYKINIFSGTTTYSSSGFNQLNVNARAAIASGGVEATSVLAQQVEQDFLRFNKIDRREAVLFLTNAFDQSVYIFGVSGSYFHPDNDAKLYQNSVNEWHTKVRNPLTNSKLRGSAFWDWADPMIYLSAMSIFNYLWYGDPYINFCTWHIGKMQFMPTTRLLLAPYGPEYQLKLNLRTPEERYLGIYLRYGNTGDISSYGIDLHINPMGEFLCLTLSNILSAWYQPHLLKSTTSINSGHKYGFGEFLRATYQVNKYTAAWGELGYKTSGYLQGTPLGSNVVWRLGVTFSLDVNPKTEHKLCPPPRFPIGACD